MPTCLVHAQLFQRYDRDGSGTIDHRELRAVMHHMNINLANDVYKVRLDSTRLDSTRLAMTASMLFAPRLAIQGMFEKFDVDKSGHLEIDEFTTLLTQIRSVPIPHSVPKTPSKMCVGWRAGSGLRVAF